ncbi:MAG: AsmA-like C-terminal region-containing protein [Amoebophilaceae bacterium]|jgi:hypothetical protein|nr:AsmA-like C-terminal region-containing protein [Amoebophilaceae bacterium]
MAQILSASRRILAALFLLLGLVVVATGVYCYHYQDKIIQRFLDETNKQLRNPIRIGSIRCTFLKSFPNITLTLHNVVVEDHLASDEDVLTACKIYCSFDLWRLMQGQCVLTSCCLEDGKINLMGNSGCQLAWAAGVQHEIPLAVALQRIYLKNMEVMYGGERQHYVISAEQVQASVGWKHSKLEINLQGRATVQRIQLKDLSCARELPISLKASLLYDQRKQIWTLRPVQIRCENSLLTVQGNWGIEAASALTIQGKKINLQRLLDCLPEQYYPPIRLYNLYGELTLDLKAHRQQGRLFALQGDFVFSNGTFSVGQFPIPIRLCQLSGNLSIPNVQDLTTATLSIDKMASTLAGSELSGNLVLHNFRDPHLQCAAKATLDLASLDIPLAHVAITDASGKLNVHWEFAVNLRQLMCGVHTKEHLHFSGVLRAQAARFKLGSSQLLCKDLTGSLIFDGHDLVMKDLSAHMGLSNFVLDGTVHNLLPYLFSGIPKPRLDAKLYVDYLDLDELLHEKHTPAVQAKLSSANFDLTSYWVLDLDCDIRQCHFRRVKAKNLHGKIQVKDQKLVVRDLQLNILGGKSLLDGVLDASTGLLNIHTTAKLQGLQIADLFYAFENFQQNFLTDKHLNGEVFSDVDLTIQADRQWNMNWESLQADIGIRLHNGMLKNFDPVQQLAKYVAGENLTSLHFSELKNHILIKNKKIHLTPMEVHSNLTRIQLSGTHTFDGEIDYHFGVSFAGLQHKGGEARSEVLNADTSAGINLFFNLRGDINRYKISYDAESSRASLKGALREQGKIIGTIVQGGYQPKIQPPELAPDDYFDFD